MNCFKFHSVGQGLFYTGSLAHKTYNFVYDCGTKSKQQYLLSSIDTYVNDMQVNMNSKPKIEFVVISHLHKDHFSGLFELAHKTDIRKVYLPYLGRDKNFISLILAYIIFGNNQHKSNDEYSYSLFNFVCGLYGIENNDNFMNMESMFLGIDGIEYEDDKFIYSMHHNYAYFESQKYWKFVFINRGISISKILYLNKKMYDVLSIYAVSDIIELISLKNGISKIAAIYNEVFSPKFLNMISSVLIHYPLYNSPNLFYADSKELMERTKRNIHMRRFNYKYPCGHNCLKLQRLLNTSTVLTGDILIESEIGDIISSHLKQNSCNCSSECGVLQVPHHGAKVNWEAWSKISIDSQVYAISFGLGNNHHHPHSNTISDLITFQKHIQLINQIQDFEYYID